MKERFLHIATLMVMLLCFASCHSQTASYDADSIRFVNAGWSTTDYEGFTFKQYRFKTNPLFHAPQHLFLVEIPASSSRKIEFVFDSSTAIVPVFAKQYGAAVAINGSFFDMQTGLPVCYLRIEGHDYGENTPALADSINRKYYQYATIVSDSMGLQILIPDSSRHWEQSLSSPNIMTAGPMLIFHDSIIPQRQDRTFSAKRHNRTALGIRHDGTILLLVADGRDKEHAEGLALVELQKVMSWLGCRDAINLDGGGSSTMFIDGRPFDGVVNYPSDNFKHDHEGCRSVSNAIIVR